MTFNIATIFLLLLPGFWSFGIYQNLDRMDLESRSEWIKLIYALTFGLLNISFSMLILLKYGGQITSLSQLYTIFTGEHGELTGFINTLSSGEGFFTAPFAHLLILLTICSLLMPLVIWYVVRFIRHIGRDTLSRNLARLISFYFPDKFDSTIERIVYSQLDGKSCIARVYPLGKKEEALTGIMVSRDSGDRGVQLLASHLFSKEEPFLDNPNTATYIDLENLVAVEISLFDPILQKERFNELYQSYQNKNKTN